MRPPFTLLAGNRQQSSPSVGRRAKDDNNIKEGATPTSSTPSRRRLHGISNASPTINAAQPRPSPSPSMFTRSPVREGDAFSSTAYILDDMMDTYMDDDTEDLDTVPLLPANDILQNNNNIFAPRAKTLQPSSSSTIKKRALQVKSTGKRIEIRLIEQETIIRPEHVPLPPSSPLKQHRSPVKRALVAEGEVDEDEAVEPRVDATFLRQDDVAEQAAAIPLPPSPVKPRTEAQQDASIHESPSPLCEDAESPALDADTFMPDASPRHDPSTNILPPPSSPHKDPVTEAALQAEAALSPTEEHAAVFPHVATAGDAELDGDTTLDMARNVELPLSPEKAGNETLQDLDLEASPIAANAQIDDDDAQDEAQDEAQAQAESSTTQDQELLAKYKQGVEDMLDLLLDDSSEDEDQENNELEKEYKAAERAVFKAALCDMMDVDDSEEDEIDLEMKEEVFNTLREAREAMQASLSGTPDEDVAAEEVEAEEEETRHIREVCHDNISELSKSLLKKKEDREAFTEQMKDLLTHEEKIIRQEEEEAFLMERGLKSPAVEHVKTFIAEKEEQGQPEAATSATASLDQECDADRTLQLAINTELPPSPIKQSVHAHDREDREKNDTDAQQEDQVIIAEQSETAQQGSHRNDAPLTTSDREREKAASPSPASGSGQAVIQSPNHRVATEPQSVSTPSTSRLVAPLSTAKATPPPAQSLDLHNEAHLKAPTAAARQLSKGSNKSTTTTIRGRGRPKGTVKKMADKLAEDVKDIAGPASLREMHVEQDKGPEVEMEMEKPARRSTRSKTALSRSASKESLASIASTTSSTSTTKAKRGATTKRKRSASIASQVEVEAPSASGEAVKDEDMTMDLNREPACQTSSDQRSAPEVTAEASFSSKAPPTTAKRASRRIAAVSSLPQPKSKVRARQPSGSEQSSSTSSSTTVPPATKESSNKRRKMALCSAETSSDQLVMSASCASTTPREAVLPVKRAIPQRSTRTTGSNAAASRGKASAASAKRSTQEPASVLRSPSRVVGSPKRSNALPNQQQQPKKTVPLFAQPHTHRGKDNHVPSPGPRAAPRSPSRVMQAQNVISPVKAAASTISSINVATVRSPLRIPGAGGNFEWPKANSTSQKAEAGSSKPVTGYSEETWMRARSKVFGNNVPAKHAGTSSTTTANALKSSTTGSKLSSSVSSSSAAPAIVSPIKTAVSQRMLAPPSPGLLNLSQPPEALLLVSTSSAPIAAPAAEPANLSSSFLTTTAEPPNVAAASAVFSSRRGTSQPPQGSSQAPPKEPAALASPRRALSAQPPPSPRRVDLPSPRRVIALSSTASRPIPSPARVVAVFSAPPAGAASSSTTPAASRLPSLVTKQAAASSGPSSVEDETPPIVTPKTQSTAIPAGRRSARTTKQRAKFADNAAAPALNANKPTASARALPARALPPTKSAPGMTVAQLAALTMKNTNNNKAHYNVHKVTTIYKDEDRPPSPTSKIRKIIEESEPVSVSSSKPSRAGSKRKAEEAGFTLDKGKGKMVNTSSTMTASGRKPHFKAAGDEDVFESPVKIRKVDSGDRAVKWDRELLKEVQDIRTPRRARQNASQALSRKTFRLNHELDANGNVADCKASLSPMLPRQQVPISKIIYKDDPDE